MKRVGQVYREKLVDHVEGSIKDNSTLFLLSYTKVSGSQMNDLRRNLRQAGAKVYVSNNAIARIALSNLKNDPLAQRVSGQVALVWSNSDSVAVSKALVKFAKTNENVKVRGGLLDGRLLEADDVKKLADLPSKEVLLSMLLGTLQAPLSRLAGALNAKTRDLLSILKQLSEKGGN